MPSNLRINEEYFQILSGRVSLKGSRLTPEQVVWNWYQLGQETFYNVYGHVTPTQVEQCFIYVCHDGWEDE